MMITAIAKTRISIKFIKVGFIEDNNIIRNNSLDTEEFVKNIKVDQ